ncbi:methyltransferase domain-containing protein [Xinfangfangia sp. D13-10-4-6]|uniref:class I SAM-dependent methyltransferase n=1 Tax=Pseudogemmobacter hezensis TaxID=2737662 RepID=UPI001552B08B|nr:class I SAM-dependent methyltransferase [Pseudogemmobacter hezensis]NPD16978.1 methyltransferase domain-containing protein [Pseudogemmobacter hezensis]
MSNGYSAGFPLTAYPARFHREAAPTWLAAILNARGVVAPAVTGTSWCEIGCGQGLDTLILAATNPGMQFWGIDFDPDHIDRAERMARAAGLENAHFLQADIRDANALAGLPSQFDFIIQHGIYSWVSPDIQAALRHFAASRLAPGGALMVQYISQPGAGLFLALQSMLAALGGPDRSVADRIRILRDMAAAGAGFFAQYPHASAVLDRLKDEDPALVAHEYLGAGVSAFSAHEMIAAHAALGLSYIGAARAMENYDSVSLPARTQPLIAAEPDAALREVLRDTARNQHIRYDIYQRGPRLMTAEERMIAAQSRRYLALPGLPAPGPVTFRSAIGPVDGDGAIFRPLLALLSKGEAGFMDLAQALDGQAGIAEQALMMLMDAGAVHPMRTDSAGDAGDHPARLIAALADGAKAPNLRIESRIGSAFPGL